MNHPKFLRFLWRHHTFKFKSDELCTKKCAHCDKEKHRPRDSDVYQLDSVVTASVWPHGNEGYEYRKCRVCGKVERRFVEVGPGAGFPGPWEKVNI